MPHLWQKMFLSFYYWTSNKIILIMQTAHFFYCVIIFSITFLFISWYTYHTRKPTWGKKHINVIIVTKVYKKFTNTLEKSHFNATFPFFFCICKFKLWITFLFIYWYTYHTRTPTRGKKTYQFHHCDKSLQKVYKKFTNTLEINHINATFVIFIQYKKTHTGEKNISMSSLWQKFTNTLEINHINATIRHQKIHRGKNISIISCNVSAACTIKIKIKYGFNPYLMASA